MILVITGTEVHQFDRLVAEMDRLAESGRLGEPVFVQRGHTPYEPKYCEWRSFIDFGEMCARIQEASVIVSHAGAGATLLCLQYKRRPVIVPRYKRLKEHVDDHQTSFSEKLDALGLVLAVPDTAHLEDTIKEARSHGDGQSRTTQASGIVRFLEDFWAKTAACN